MALDSATSAFLAEMAKAGGPALHEMTPQEAREMSDGFIELVGEGPEMARVENVTVTSTDGHEVPVRVLVPSDDARGFIVYLHGGGWVVGSIDGYDTLGRQLAERTDCAVAIVDYRLAPEHKFPAAADDSWAVLKWAAENRGRYAASDGPLVVAGDSAGGNLSAVVAQRTVREAGPKIDLQVLVYPVTDDNFDNASYLDPANELMLTATSMKWFWDLYVPEVADRARWEAAPLKAKTLAGVAPAAVLVSEHDVLHDEGRAYARKLAESGVPVREKIFAGQMHGFFQFVNVLPGAKEGMDYVVDAVNDVVDGKGIADAVSGKEARA
ncbi:alpha/beta hydrolase [Rhodococcus sp. O3]|uniref:alpha/beta hydrolase n=1 Tax=Rhodococcus sp. O3 TaxID=3404919 RepID=UPI003B6768EA